MVVSGVLWLQVAFVSLFNSFLWETPSPTVTFEKPTDKTTINTTNLNLMSENKLNVMKKNQPASSPNLKPLEGRLYS